MLKHCILNCKMNKDCRISTCLDKVCNKNDKPYCVLSPLILYNIMVWAHTTRLYIMLHVYMQS